MQTRRMIVVSLAGAAAAAGVGVSARAGDDPVAKPAEGTTAAKPTEKDGRPNPNIIAGKPIMLDYGGGLKVPCNRDAFFTLWEGETFWLTFGFGISQSAEHAQSLANRQAANLMKFMLLTLAFAPDRLVKSASMGWRKKNPSAHDFVIGDLALPGAPMKSVADNFLGRGTIDIGELSRWDHPSPDPDLNGPKLPKTYYQIRQNAMTSYFVLKKDMNLNDVRKRAKVMQL